MFLAKNFQKIESVAEKMICVYAVSVQAKLDFRLLIRRTVATFLLAMLLLLNCFSTAGAYIELCHHSNHNSMILSQCNQINIFSTQNFSHDTKLVNHTNCNSCQVDEDVHEFLCGVTNVKKLKLACRYVKYSLETESFSGENRNLEDFATRIDFCLPDSKIAAVRSVCLII